METTARVTQRRQGRTLRELIIFVAVVAVAAAISISQFRKAAVRYRDSGARSDKRLRALASRVGGDMRSMVTGIEAYRADHGVPPSQRPLRSSAEEPAGDTEEKLRRAGGWYLTSVESGEGESLHGVTTPVAFIAGIPSDPFAPSKSIPYAYYTDGIGWILFSPGSDGVYNIVPEIDYDGTGENPSANLLQKTFDATNGSRSAGDLWRIAAE
jgi:hypothetical protein